VLCTAAHFGGREFEAPFPLAMFPERGGFPCSFHLRPVLRPSLLMELCFGIEGTFGAVSFNPTLEVRRVLGGASLFCACANAFAGDETSPVVILTTVGRKCWVVYELVPSSRAG